jgi:uncharacterized membrane protein (UPF0136 family)
MKLYEVGNTLGQATVEAAVGGAIGYLSTWAFTSLNPLSGAIFGATYVGAGLLLDPIFNTKNSTTFSKLLGIALKATIAAAVALTSLGMAFSLAATLALTVSAVLIPIAIVIATSPIIILPAAIIYVLYQRHKEQQTQRQIAREIQGSFGNYV